MAEILEISSDSCDTTILAQDSSFSAYEQFICKETNNVEDIVKKYTLTDPEQLNLAGKSRVQCSDSFSDDELIVEPLHKRLKKTVKCADISSSSSDVSSDDLNIVKEFSDKHKQDCVIAEEAYSSSAQQKSYHQDENDILQKLSAKYKQVNEKQPQADLRAVKDASSKSSNKEQQKLEKQLEKERKLLERRQKKEEADRNKAIKQALTTANKNIKPTECMKFVKIHIDNNLTREKFGQDILSALQAAEVTCDLRSQLIPNIITWSRALQSHLLNDDGKLTISTDSCGTDEVLIVMNLKAFLEHVKNGTLCTHIKSVKSVTLKKRFFIAIVGLEKYFKHYKYQHNRDFKSAITDGTNEKRRSSYQELPQISKNDIELALTELQLLCLVSHCLVETGPELGQMVVQFTKAVAQLPYKQEKHKKQLQTDWFASGENKDCVKVDNNGNGLMRLWNQVLTTFPLARLEAADAITSAYATPSQLMEAYKNCNTQGEKLLQDIPIRRAAGPLTSVRKIGPELSKKVYNFFTSLDGDTLL